MIKVKILKEEGFDCASFGTGLSFGKTSEADFFSDGWDKVAAGKVIKKLAPMDGGHNKSLESIDVWIDVTAPRYWWQEADTYRLTTKQSDSTIHTIVKDGINHKNLPVDFDVDLPEDLIDVSVRLFVDISAIFDMIKNHPDATKSQKTLLMKKLLPENFMQRRVWKVDYKSLKNIIEQRKNHLVPEWRIFCEEVLSQVKNPELLPTL